MLKLLPSLCTGPCPHLFTPSLYPLHPHPYAPLPRPSLCVQGPDPASSVWTPSNFFNSEVSVHPSPPRKTLKLVHYKVWTEEKRAVSI